MISTNYNLVFISSYETISFSIAWPRKLKTRTVILNHNNLDELQNKVKYLFFKLIPKHVEHIVFEEYMRDYLKESIKIDNKIWVIHHPISYNKVNDFKKLDIGIIDSNNKYVYVFAPSGSNDEIFIKKLIEIQKTGILNKTKIKIVIKSNNYNYEDEHLKVFNNYLDYKDYLKYFSLAKLILLPYIKEFNYRVSGVLFDAIAFSKKIIVSNNKFFKEFIKKYPFVGVSFINEYDFVKKLIALLSSNILELNNKEKKLIESDYSEANLINKFNLLIYNKSD